MEKKLVGIEKISSDDELVKMISEKCSGLFASVRGKSALPVSYEVENLEYTDKSKNVVKVDKGTYEIISLVPAVDSNHAMTIIDGVVFIAIDTRKREAGKMSGTGKSITITGTSWSDIQIDNKGYRLNFGMTEALKEIVKIPEKKKTARFNVQ